MSKVLVGLLALTLAVLAGPALAVDLDNNRIENDEIHMPGTFDGETDRDETVIFPTSGDTWDVASYPYWWHVGDTVYGVHELSEACVDHVDLTLKISYNVLNSGGHVDLDFRIDGTTVGSLIVTEGDGVGYVYASFDFAPMSPPFELRYYETNAVATGAGSISIDQTGLCSAAFSTCLSAVEQTTWSRVKALYQ
jgi:hypothetical protein